MFGTGNRSSALKLSFDFKSLHGNIRFLLLSDVLIDQRLQRDRINTQLGLYRLFKASCSLDQLDGLAWGASVNPTFYRVIQRVLSAERNSAFDFKRLQGI